MPPGGREVIANPTLADVMMTGALPEISFGRTDAPVTIVEYASLTCPHCRTSTSMSYPQLKQRLHRHRQGALHPARVPDRQDSGVATIALRCASPTYLTFFGKSMDQQPAWVSQEVRLDPIFKVAAQVGMTREQFDACRENQAMIDALNRRRTRTRARHHRHPQLLRPGQAHQEGAVDGGHPRDGRPVDRGPRRRVGRDRRHVEGPLPLCVASLLSASPGTTE